MLCGRQISRACRTAAAHALGVVLIAAAAIADERQGGLRSAPPDVPAYLTSPYHGVTDGDGRIIPCRCRFGGREFRLGEQVCMSTHVGTVLARCDLMLNNTSWIPTETACTISRAPLRQGTLSARSQ